MANKVQELFCSSLSALFPEGFPAPKIREKLDSINFALNHELGTTHDMYNTYMALLASWRARFMLAGLAFTTQLRLCISRSNLVDNLDLKAYYAEVSTKYFADHLCHSPTSSRSRVVKNEWTKTPSNNVPLSPRRSSDTNRCTSWISSVHTSENLDRKSVV